MTPSTVRRGGRKTPEGFLFELSGGDLSLDFVNTVDERPTERARELLPNPSELYSWSRQAGILTRKQEEALLARASRKPSQAKKVLDRALAIRECLFRLFRHVTDEKDFPPNLLAEWNSYVRLSQDHYELAPGRESMTWRLRSRLEEPDSVLWPVIHSAVQLLTGPHVSRIRRCAAENCDWMFLDTSKRGNRRWCDMSVCGNRAKARRYYHKSKQQG
jgi:predicted RNA-binding Zn ribbon-like protein